MVLSLQRFMLKQNRKKTTQKTKGDITNSAAANLHLELNHNPAGLLSTLAYGTHKSHEDLPEVFSKTSAERFGNVFSNSLNAL